MARPGYISTRVNPELLEQVDEVLGQIGLSRSDVINLVFKQIVVQQGLPFELKIPNDKTRQVIDNARAGIGVISYNTPEAMFASWEQLRSEPDDEDNEEAVLLEATAWNTGVSTRFERLPETGQKSGGSCGFSAASIYR